jgi:hypothetical protein
MWHRNNPLYNDSQWLLLLLHWFATQIIFDIDSSLLNHMPKWFFFISHPNPQQRMDCQLQETV